MLRRAIASLGLVLIPAFAELSATVTRVACVGDSITCGAGVMNREKNCYPAVLQRLLGTSHEVRNFGVSARTMLNAGDQPYQKEQAFRDALAFEPHIVLIKLGTNDSKPQNWAHKGDFKRDTLQLLDAFATLPSKPRIFVVLPVPAFPGNWGISEEVIRDEVVPLLREAAKERSLPVIDLHTPFLERAVRFPDKVHPDAKGAEGMAYLIHNAITVPAGSRNTAIIPAVNPGPALWGGYDWLARHQTDCELAQRGEAELICIGDSITHGFGGEPRLDQGAGEPVWREKLERWKPINMGFSGDKTEHVLWRLAHRAVDGAKPKAAMVMIGTNNLQSNTPDEIAEGVGAILRTLREKLPHTRVLLLAIFPRGERPSDLLRIKAGEVNRRLARLGDGRQVVFKDIGPVFLDASGVLSREIMPDFLHPNERGYRLWADAVVPLLSEMID